MTPMMPSYDILDIPSFYVMEETDADISDTQKVCDVTYSCMADRGGGMHWEKNAERGTARECKSDILTAAAVLNSCPVNFPVQDPSSECTVKYRSGKPVVYLQRTHEGVQQYATLEESSLYGLPSLLDADWTCAAKPPNYKKTHTETFGSLKLSYLKPSSPLPPPEEQLFRKIDTNHDGVISRREMRRYTREHDLVADAHTASASQTSASASQTSASDASQTASADVSQTASADASQTASADVSQTASADASQAASVATLAPMSYMPGSLPTPPTATSSSAPSFSPWTTSSSSDMTTLFSSTVTNWSEAPQPKLTTLPTSTSTSVANPDGTHRCDLTKPTFSRACKVDATCPLPSKDESDLFFNVSMTVGAQSGAEFVSNKGLCKFLQSVQGVVDETLSWNRVRASNMTRAKPADCAPDVDSVSTSGKTINPTKTKRQMRELFRTDPEFQRTAREIMSTHPKYVEALRSQKEGLCQEGVCAATTTRPTDRLYNGAHPISFAKDGLGQVTYQRNGVVQAARATKCPATDCSKVDPMDLTPEAMVARSCCNAAVAPDNALSTDASVDAYYKTTFDGVDYLVFNSVNAADPAECAPRLCEHNRDVCPAPLCRVDAEGACVAK